MSIVDDYAGIRRRMRELQGDKDTGWRINCELCGGVGKLDYGRKTCTRCGGVGHFPHCDTCENGGWVEVPSPRAFAFKVCPDCDNPNEYPSP